MGKKVMNVGTVRTTTPIPPIVENTRYIDAGALKFGIEYRIFNGDVLAEHSAKDPEDARRRDAVFAEYGASQSEVDDQGLSLHVFDASTDTEYLRFDMFDDNPHYHYLSADSHRDVNYDEAANGDYRAWVIRCVEERLASMLSEIDSDVDLATQVDPASIEAALPKIREAFASTGATPSA